MKRQYIICDVEFYPGGKTYCYIADDDSYNVDDMVLVPAGKDNHEAVVKIVAKNVYAAKDSPFPTDKTKHIICHVDEDDLDKYKNVVSKPEVIETENGALGSIYLEEQEDGSLKITQADYNVSFYGGMDVEAIYTLDKENVQKLKERLRRNHKGNLENMMVEEFGRCFEKKSFSKFCEENGIENEPFVWID